ncbi:MAG: hypothetical protein ACI8W8_000977 [Rhodothermales bacterium]|jgi:hypothetical protein
MKTRSKIALAALATLLTLFSVIVYVVNRIDGIPPRVEALNCEGTIRQLAFAISQYQEEEGCLPVSQAQLYQWANLDPKYFRCRFFESVDASQYVIHFHLLGSSSRKIVAHCPATHRPDGKGLDRFTSHPSCRSVVYTDLSTPSVLEVDFRVPAAQTRQLDAGSEGMNGYD